MCPTVSLQPFNHFMLLSQNPLHIVCFLLIKRQQRQDSRCNFSRSVQENGATHLFHTIQSPWLLSCHIALEMPLWVAAHWYLCCDDITEWIAKANLIEVSDCSKWQILANDAPRLSKKKKKRNWGKVRKVKSNTTDLFHNFERFLGIF